MVLLLGLVVGLAMALRVQIGSDSRPVEARAALTARKESLLEQLREHDGDKKKMDPEAWQERREALLSEAAEVLRQFEEGPADLAFETPTPTGRRVKMGWMAGLVAFFVLAAGLVSQFASERPDDDMGGGDDVLGQFAVQVEEARAVLAENPDDLAALNILAHVAVEQKSMQEAMELMDRARALAPNDPEVRVHMNALRLLVGMGNKAQESLEQVLEEHPDMSEAMRWMSYARFNQGDLDGAISWLERASQTGSDLDQFVARMWLLELRTAQAQTASSGPSSAAAGSQEAEVQPAGPPSVQGMVQVDAGQAPTAGGTLFVLARASESERGPPLAAVKLGSVALPAAFGLGSGDLIRGGAWPDQVWLKAKWSASGDPMTTRPGDLVSAMVGPISTGAEGVSLVLVPFTE